MAAQDGECTQTLRILLSRSIAGIEGLYEAYEVKNKREKLRCLLLHRKKKNIFFIFMM
jgi:hypothetical protein